MTQISPLSVNYIIRSLRDWPRWWAEQSLLRKLFPILSLTIYMIILYALNGIRIDHYAIVCILLFLAYGGRATQPLLRFLLPLVLIGIIYDSQRHYSDYIRGPVHVTEPYNFDKRFFGIETAEGVLTPNEWFEKHTHWFLDLITGFAYLVYIAEFAVIAAWYTVWTSRKGTAKRSAAWVKAYAPRLMWAFLIVNLIGISTYYWYAASPPWYVALYGFGPARFDVPANPAGALRFDQLLGTSFFTGMYGRSADVHGAIPSLHVAYPLMAVYYSFRIGSLRAFSILFCVLMSFAAVYLNHHYVLDVLIGWFYGITVAVGVDAWLGRKRPVSV